MRKRLLPLLLVLALALAGTVRASGQGCSQCRETVGQTPARTQQAYRRGIGVLMVAGVALFAGTIAGVRRFR